MTRVFLDLPVMQDRLFIATTTLLSLFYCADGDVTVLTNGNDSSMRALVFSVVLKHPKVCARVFIRKQTSGKLYLLNL